MSAETGGDVFKYFDADTMLVEIEAGVARNEPVTYAVRKAIEAGVVSLINEGAEKDLWEFDVKEVKVPEIKDYVDTDIRVDIGEEKVEKTYEMYLEEKKAKKDNELADKKLKDAANEEAWNQIEEQDEKTNDNDSSDSGNHHN